MKYRIEDLTKGITPQNRYPEIDTGEPVGNEFPNDQARSTDKPDGPCVIVRGDMAYDGFIFVGPFENFAAADRYGQSYAENELWTVERLVKPEEKL